MKKFLVFLYIAFLVLVLSFPRILWEVKLLILFPVFFWGFLRFLNGINLKKYPLLFLLSYLIFFLLFCFIGLIKGNDITAVINELRLQIVFPFVFLFFVIAQESLDRKLSNFHTSILISSFLISMSFIYLFCSYFFGLYIPNYFVKEFNMVMGIHPTYIQVNMESVGMLFFITPYLTTQILIKNEKFPILEIIALIIVSVCAIVSGRRALWLCLLMSPFISVLLIKIAGFRERLGFLSYFSIFGVGLILLTYFLFINGMFDYVFKAFSNVDERTLQKPFLINGFYQQPFLGSGIGGLVDYVRSDTQPWLFELTYHQRLFNFGLFGFILFHAMIGLYSYFKLRHSSFCFPYQNANFISIGSGILILFIGSYSNPYMSSFDFLFLMWLFFLYGCVGLRINNVHK